jgi:hypothetical protein
MLVQCENIDLQPDQCSFVQQNCHGFDGFYLELYYCAAIWKPISVFILVRENEFLFKLNNNNVLFFLRFCVYLCYLVQSVLWPLIFFVSHFFFCT